MAATKRPTLKPTGPEDERAVYRRAVDVYLAACYRARSRATTSEFAERYGVTAPSLNRIFQRLFHQTPLQFFRARQLQHAARLLEQSPQTIDEIAERSALGTRATLFRRFIEHFGVTPEEHRREETRRGKK
jgi:AraC-like DNA-binding protein